MISTKKLIERIKDLEGDITLSKHEQLVLGIVEALNAGDLKIGDQLPSINVMVDEMGFARKTIVKAYEELKDRGLVGSKKTKGYFVISNKTDLYKRIALIMYSFQRFQQEFYNSLRDELQEKVQIDVFFHHNNDDVFETIFSNISRKYGRYVVAPIVSEKSRALLKTLKPEKLIIVDRFLDLGPEYTYVTQEFNESTFSNLDALKNKIFSYKKLTLFYCNDRDYPEGILQSFERFSKMHSLDFQIETSYLEGTVKKDMLYLFISDADLWPLLKDCQSKALKIGQEVGILSFNDHVVKELVSGGITTISTDFKQMAITTARNILDLSQSKIIIPTTMIDRNSL